MTRHGITYIGYEKDAFGYLVKFNINGIIYKYDLEFYWVEKVERIARHSEPKALQMAKRYGQVVDKIESEKRKDKHGSNRNTEERHKTDARPEAVCPSNSIEFRLSLAKPVVDSAIQRALKLVQKQRLEGDIDRNNI